MYAILKTLVLPPACFFVAIAAGLALRFRYPRAGASIAWVGGLLFYAASTTVVGHFSVTAVETAPGPSFEILAQSGAEAIVILSAGMEADQPEYSGDTVDERTLVRFRYGARVQRATGLPVLVTGGVLRNTATPVGVAMSAALTDDFGIGAQWIESRSRTTAENASLSRAILAPLGIDRVILVTHAAHMRRSRAVFESAGFDVIPAPTGFSRHGPVELASFMPSIGGLEDSHIAAYEAVGWLWYLLTREI